jgi:uncharacterized protein
VFVNLYAPSRLRWRQNGRTVTLEQATSYPLDSAIGIVMRTAAPETFTVGLRIPAWAGNGSAVAVNGRRLQEPLVPGTFHKVHRTWNDGDQLALTLDRTLRLEAVDEKHPDLLAVMHGPLALFAIGDRFLPFKRTELTALRQTAARSAEWRVTTSDGVQQFRPYFAIDSGTTRLYQPASA